MGDDLGPLRLGAIDDLVVVGQLGQSLDGRIATPTGHSHYINGPAGLNHLHRLRALVDAVWSGSAPLGRRPGLTVRRVEGPQPARVVIDPNGRLKPTARLLNDDGVRRLVISARRTPALRGVDWRAACRAAGGIAPAAILRALAERGLKRILIEGGADAVSRFLAARCLDRLHVVVARSSSVPAAAALRCRRSRADEAMHADACAPARRRCCSTAICRLTAPRCRASTST